MYNEQEKYFANGHVSKRILMQKNISKDVAMWIMDHGLPKIIGLFNSKMQVSMVILTNEFGMCTTQVCIVLAL